MAKKIVSTRKMIEALYEKFIVKPAAAGNPFLGTNPQIEPPVKPRLMPQLNLYPEEGVVYKNADAVAGEGQTKMYDYNNGEVVIVNNCGPIGTK